MQKTCVPPSNAEVAAVFDEFLARSRAMRSDTAPSSGSVHEAPERCAHRPPLAHPRAHSRLPARGRVGAADAWRPRRFPALGAGHRLGRPVAKFLVDRPHRVALRWRGGELLGWDSKDSDVGSSVPTLRDRMPDDPRKHTGPDFDALPFTSLYLRNDEFAAEIANATMHGVMHLGWVPGRADGLRGHRAVEAKRSVRYGIRGGHQPIPLPDRVPSTDARDRAGVASVPGHPTPAHG